MSVMISVAEAKELIGQHSTQLDSIELSILDALDYHLAENVVSKVDFPSFDQSAMDGYAVSGIASSSFTVIGEIKAGDNPTLELNEGEAIRIFTGALVPDSADVVVMQEKVTRDGDTISIEGEIKDGENIRRKGENLKTGEVVLEKGHLLGPPSISLLASCGHEYVKVFKKPEVGLIVTGDELQSLGSDLERGKVYESNSYSLRPALTKFGYNLSGFQRVPDTLQDTINAIKDALDQSDVLILTGAISVGDYDFVGTALQELEVEQIIYKIKQKPGKPMFFGKSKEGKLVFALPGNPAASLTCFYEYVLPALRILSGNDNPFMKVVQAPVVGSARVKGDRDIFLKAFFDGNKAHLLDGKSSYVISSMAHANAFVFGQASLGDIQENQVRDIHLLPE